jgi:hypothetical protein
MKFGDRLAQERKPLANKIRLLDRDSRHVATRMLQALNQAAANRIKRNGKNNKNGRYCLPEDRNGGAISDDDICTTRNFATDIRFGARTDMTVCPIDVRFASENEHRAGHNPAWQHKSGGPKASG